MRLGLVNYRPLKYLLRSKYFKGPASTDLHPKTISFRLWRADRFVSSSLRPLKVTESFCYDRPMSQGQVIIAPSLLSADFSHLAEGIQIIENGEGDWVHLDIMDGSFVPNITFGPQMVAALRPHTRRYFDAHLMIVRPDQYIAEFVEAGADGVTIHYESIVHVHRALAEIRRMGKKAGISIVPSTPAESLSELLCDVDLILVMTVNPGFGGQELIPRTLEKVRTLDRLRREGGYRYLIEVDGGINRKTCREAVEAGADVLVVGSAVFNADDPAKEIRLLKGNRKTQVSG
jgi:ribulose-phosphate 3-epimerase